MKNTAISVLVIIIFLGGLWYFYKLPSGTSPVVVPPNEQASIVGCYMATLGKDVYTLNVQSQSGDNFTGALSFKNFEKDSSSGTYVGTYKDGILLGDYSFQSEGMFSVIQVIFKKSDDTFVRGFGDMNSTGDRFADLNKITFDPKQTFILSPCAS